MFLFLEFEIRLFSRRIHQSWSTIRFRFDDDHLSQCGSFTEGLDPGDGTFASATYRDGTTDSFAEPDTSALQPFMHQLRYPPYRDAQEGGSRPARKDSDEEDPDEKIPEMTIGHGRTQPLQRRVDDDGVETWVPIPEVLVYGPMFDTDVEDETSDDSAYRLIDEYEEEESEPSEDVPIDDAGSMISGDDDEIRD